MSLQSYRVDALTGRVNPAQYIPSPNQDQRPDGIDVDLIVIHGISLPPRQFGSREIEQFFSNGLSAQAHPYFKEIEGLTVSAHCLIDRAGGITQFVPFHARAWHAGDSCHCNRDRCNDFSIGIELEGTDDCPYEVQQYATLSQLIVALRQAYPSLRGSDIVGHSDISPGRKTDPGPAFRWQTLTDMISRLEQTASYGRS